MTLRRRVLAALVCLVALFTLIQGVIAVVSLHEQEDDLVDELVLAETRRLAGRIEHSGPTILGGDGRILLPEGYEAWWTGAGRALPQPPPAALGALAAGAHRFSSAGGEHHVMVTPVADGRLVVRYDASRNEERVRQFTTQVLVLGLFFVALAALIARHVARLLVAPLEKVARLLDHWAPASDPGTVAAVDEEKRVFDAFQRVQLRWERGLARESERLADLHHELRTPLAALRTDLEMLELGAAAPGARADAGRAQRLQRCLAAVDTLAGALESMRALSAGRAGRAERLRLADCVADAWTSLGDLPAQRSLGFVNAVDAQAEATLDRQALMAILRNLFRNAAEHAAPATLRVSLDGATLVVADDGPGIAAEDRAFVFERYYRGRLADAPGAPADPGGDYRRGLGLAIARELAVANGWQLDVAPSVPRGTQFRLDLQESGPR